MTYITNPENSLINVVNWCNQWDGSIVDCLVKVFNSPATTQIINNWHAVGGVL